MTVGIALFLASLLAAQPQVTPERSQVIAVFRAELERVQAHPPRMPIVCLGTSSGVNYDDPEPEVLFALRKEFPTVAAASRCPDSGLGIIVVGPFFREGDRLVAKGGEWAPLLGRCTYILTKRLFRGWRARYQPCPLE